MPRISQKSNDFFLFRCYGSHGGDGGIHDWYDALPPEVQAEFDVAMETLAASRKASWPTTIYQSLRGSGDGLTKIEIAIPKAGADPDSEDERDKDQYRILCFEGPGKREVTLLYGFKKEINADYGPAVRSAQSRREGVLKDGQRARPCRFP